METGNKFGFILILALSSHLLYAAQAVCVPRTFRYLEPSSSSPAPAPLNQSQPQPKPTPSPPKAQTMLDATPSTPSTSAPKQELSVPTIGLTPISSEMKKVCDGTDNPLLCITYVPAFLHGEFDHKSIVIATVKAALNHTRAVVELANKIIADPKTPTDIVGAIEFCKENYEIGIFNLEEVLEKEIPKHNMEGIMTKINGCVADLSTCHDNFGEATTSPSPLAAMDNIMEQLCNVALATVDNFKW